MISVCKVIMMFVQGDTDKAKILARESALAVFDVHWVRAPGFFPESRKEGCKVDGVVVGYQLDMP